MISITQPGGVVLDELAVIIDVYIYNSIRRLEKKGNVLHINKFIRIHILQRNDEIGTQKFCSNGWGKNFKKVVIVLLL